MGLRELFGSREREPDGNLVGFVNQLATRVERLELEHAERQVQVLRSVEKVTHQLNAMIAKRQSDAAPETEVERDDGSPQVAAPRRAPSTAHLALRRFGRG